MDTEFYKTDNVFLFQMNSQKINRHFLVSGETKTKHSSQALKHFSFTPRKSIQHFTPDINTLTFNSNTRKPNKVLKNSSPSKESAACNQQYGGGEITENKDPNFADIDDLLESNLTDKTLMPKVNKLTCLPESHVYIQSKCLCHFLLIKQVPLLKTLLYI